MIRYLILILGEGVDSHAIVHDLFGLELLAVSRERNLLRRDQHARLRKRLIPKNKVIFFGLNGETQGRALESEGHVLDVGEIGANSKRRKKVKVRL